MALLFESEVLPLTLLFSENVKTQLGFNKYFTNYSSWIRFTFKSQLW
jgi:hypothetical protein